MKRLLMSWGQSLCVGAVAAAVLTVGLSFSVNAGDDPIASRKAMMQTVKAATKLSVGMVKGERPFDPAVAELAVRAMNTAASGVVNFFPDNSKTGGKTTASPKIWEDMAGFKAKMAKFEADTAKAVKAAANGADAFKVAFGAATKNCKGCHQEYRVKKKK